jgi:hypothetical protein
MGTVPCGGERPPQGGRLKPQNGSRLLITQQVQTQADTGRAGDSFIVEEKNLIGLERFMEFGIIESIILMMILVWFGTQESGAGAHQSLRRLGAVMAAGNSQGPYGPGIRRSLMPGWSSHNAKRGAISQARGMGNPPPIASPRQRL